MFYILERGVWDGSTAEAAGSSRESAPGSSTSSWGPRQGKYLGTSGADPPENLPQGAALLPGDLAKVST